MHTYEESEEGGSKWVSRWPRGEFRPQRPSALAFGGELGPRHDELRARASRGAQHARNMSTQRKHMQTCKRGLHEALEAVAAGRRRAGPPLSNRPSLEHARAHRQSVNSLTQTRAHKTQLTQHNSEAHTLTQMLHETRMLLEVRAHKLNSLNTSPQRNMNVAIAICGSDFQTQLQNTTPKRTAWLATNKTATSAWLATNKTATSKRTNMHVLRASRHTSSQAIRRIFKWVQL